MAMAMSSGKIDYYCHWEQELGWTLGIRAAYRSGFGALSCYPTNPFSNGTLVTATNK